MAASYLTLEPGTSVTDRFGQPVGTVKRVLIAEASHFDGVIVSTRAGDRFVDAPEVRRITPEWVELTVDELERRVERAHGATKLRELDALLTDLD